MQSNVNSSGVSDPTAAGTTDAGSATAEEEQSSKDKAVDDALNLTEFLAAASSSANTNKSSNSKASQDVVRALGSILSGPAFGGTGPGQLKMPAGYEYLENMSPEDAIVAVNNFNSALVDQQIQASITRVQGNQDEYKKLHEQNMEKLDEYIQKTSGVGNLILKIFFFLFLIAIVALTITAAIVVPNPATIIAAVAAVMALVNSGLAIVSEVTGEDVTFSGLLRQMASGISASLSKSGVPGHTADAIGKVVAGLTGTATGLFLGDSQVLALFYEGIGQSLGMSEDAAKIFGLIMSVIAMILLMALTMNIGSGATTVAQGVQTASSSAEAASSAANLVKTLEKMTSMAQAGMQVGQAGFGMYQAGVKYEASLLQSDITKIKGFLEAITSAQDIERDMMKKLLTHIAAMKELTNKTIQSSLRASGAAFRSMV